ncbi:MAG: type II secretion system secretin GspD [Rubrivivax sp.]|nr:type II secretion system secretin GspD [Rubrivivax sp.]
MKPPRSPRPLPHRLGAAVVAALAAAGAVPAGAQMPAPGTPPAAAAGQRGTVTLNFVNADIEAVTRAIGAMINRQIAVDPRVRGTVTVYSEQPQSVREAYQTYLSALRGMGFAMVESGGLLKLVPEADAKLQTGTVSVGEAAVRGDQVITQIFTLRHENANNLVAILRPLISANNTINASPSTNTLVITDYADNLQRLGRIIAALDTPAGTEIEVIPLQHAVASDIVPLVQRLSDAGGVAQVVVPGAQGVGGATTVIADPRSNSLLVRASNPARLAAIRATVAKLDRPTAGVGPGGGMWVVHLKNADAVRLATVVRAAFAAVGSGSGASTAGTGLPQTGGVTIAQPTLGQQPGAGNTSGASAAATAPISTAAQPSIGGFIQADPATNSLIITAPEPLYRQVRAMIDQLDTRRAQVSIEGLIVEVNGGDQADFGVQWIGQLARDGDRTLQAAQVLPNTTNGGNNPSILGLQGTNIANLGGGLNIGILRTIGDAVSLNAIVRLLQTRTTTNIVSTPNVLTLDNEEAKIVVGNNVPFITGQFTNTGTATTNPFQTIERKDVGLTLRIKPTIGESGTVKMTIFLENSDVTSQAEGTTNAGPTTTKRSVETNVAVDDSQILVIGGLIQERLLESKNKVPLLGDLPLVGGLFRSESRTKSRSNLMIFLRPTVLRDGDSASRLSLDRYDMLRGQQQATQPTPSIVMPLNEGPVLPALPPAPPAAAPSGSAPAPPRP